MMFFPPPICDKCKRQVRHFQMESGVLTMRFTASCHGEDETCDLTLADLQDVTAIFQGVAFKQEQAA